MEDNDADNVKVTFADRSERGIMLRQSEDVGMRGEGVGAAITRALRRPCTQRIAKTHNDVHGAALSSVLQHHLSGQAFAAKASTCQKPQLIATRAVRNLLKDMACRL